LSHCHRRDLALGCLVQHETLTGWRYTENKPVRFRADNNIVLRIDSERTGVRLFRLEKYRSGAGARHTMDLTLVAGRHEKIALAIEGHGPYVFLVRIVECSRFSVGRNPVDFAVRIGSGVNLVF